VGYQSWLLMQHSLVAHWLAWAGSAKMMIMSMMKRPRNEDPYIAPLP
jgi:hypothetical protein